MNPKTAKSVKLKGNVDPGNFLLLVYPIVIVLLLLVGALIEVKAAGVGEENLQIDRVREGSLLFETDGGGLVPAARLSQDVKITVSGIIARVQVTQKFINRSERWLEATYVFPLPDESMVDQLELVVGEQRIVGKIMEREEAAKTYSAAKRQGKKSSLLVQNRPNVFTTKVANIGPGEEIQVEIEYQQRVRLDNGIYSLRFPMVVGPRYVPEPARSSINGDDAVVVGDKGRSVSGAASEWLQVSSTPKKQSDSDLPVQLSIDLVPGFTIQEIVSLYHGIAEEITEDGHHSIQFSGDVLADRDFVLQWKPALKTEIVTSVFSEKIGKNQYLSLMLMPPQLKSEIAVPREVVFVLDVSGSMAGTSILQAKKAITMALSRLNPVDRFNIIVFNNSASSLYPKSKVADVVSIAKAQQFVVGLKADGGTEMKDALLLALDGSFRHELLRQVIFLTDGSVANEAELFGLIDSRLGDSRLFTVGIGSAPNSYFMTRASALGRGTFTYIGKQEEVKEKMTELFVKIENPAITDLKINIDKQGADVEIYPSPLPDLYYGEPLVLAMRSGWENQQLTISGSAAGKRWATTVDTTVFGERKGVGAFWARKKIRSLMEAMALGGSKDDLRKEVVETALEHHLMSKYTSLVAVDDRVVRPVDKALSEESVKNHLPQGWQASAIYAGGPKTATPSSFLLLVGSMLLLLAVFIRVRVSQ